MSKRSREQENDSRPPKRAKSDYSAPIKEVHSARQLRDLLSFRQDRIQELKTGIASFKTFLDSVIYAKTTEEEDDKARKLGVLREYLDSQRSQRADNSEEGERPFLNDLWQAWSFANSQNDDRISSAVSSILALTLKTLSSLLEFKDHALSLARAALQHQHLRLVKRCLDAPKHKDFLISPCLRLLIEVASFDGGVLAREVYKRREQTFEVGTVRRNLGILKHDLSEEEARRRPAIRTLTVRYILALLKYLHPGGVADLLKNRPICTSLFHFVPSDPLELVKELLDVTEQSILKDAELPRSAKAALLVPQNLERITEVACRLDKGVQIEERAFAWLKAVCTKPEYGILRADTVWYPPATMNVDQMRQDDDTIDLGLDSIDFYDRDEKPAVRNTILLSWLQTLRPHSSSQERELVLESFKSAPELVAAYFAEKNVPLEPVKLSNTWIGHCSFLFEVVNLPIPSHLGSCQDEWADLPAQTSVIIESLLPRPFTQKVPTKCLNQSSELITFFAVRILVLACEKLRRVQEQLNAGAIASPQHARVWNEASSRLLERFSERCPSMKDVISTFRKIPYDDAHALQREAVTRLLRLYYTVLPTEAREEQFDISTTLTVALTRSEQVATKDEVSELRALELEHLLQIAQHSAGGIRWLSKQGSLNQSPILTLIRLHAKDSRSPTVRNLIFHVLKENQIISSKTTCEALIASVHMLNELPTALAEFLDDCFLRVRRKPVKYLDDLETLVPIQHQAEPDLLVSVLLEQTPFVLQRAAGGESKAIAGWINEFLEMQVSIDASKVTLAVRDAVKEQMGESWESSDPQKIDAMLANFRLPTEGDVTAIEPPAKDLDNAKALPFELPQAEVEDHPELFRWTRKDLELAIEEGDISALILCLCSQHTDIRTQALGQLRKLEHAILNSTIDNRDPIYVLIGELLETYEKQYCTSGQPEPLPYLAGAFATHALRIQTEPTHCIYPKLNKFLNKGPEWRVHKLPTYWLDNTILSVPDEDDAYWKEAIWVLDWLVDGLRTAADMEMLRRAGIFERVMALYASPIAGKGVKSRVMEVLFRATCVEGGATTLVTRTGVLAWLDVVEATEGAGGIGLAGAMKMRVLERCDRAKLKEWSGVENLHEL